MTRNRKLLISAVLLAILGLLIWLAVRRFSAAPEAVRLLPEGDVLVYANLKPVHLFELREPRPAQVEGEYKQFIDQTGIQFERDLDEVAMSRRDTPDGKDTESSEIFAGRFDQQRLAAWLRSISTSTEDFAGHTIFLIPHEGHIVRVAILDPKRVAVTNMASADPMHAIIDSSRSPGKGPSLLRSHYSDIPTGSLGWAIIATRSGTASPQIGGLSFDFLNNTITVGSLRYTGDVHLRADVITRSDADARRVLDSADSFLSLYRSVSQSIGTKGTDADVKAALDSIRVEQKNNVAVFTATLSQNFLKKLVSEAQSESPAPEPSPSPSASPHRRRRHK